MIYVQSCHCVASFKLATFTPWLQVKGDILYNGKDFSKFFVERSAGYVEQTDQHYAPLTVRETFDFAAWCQGTGYRRGEVWHRSLRLQVHVVHCVKLTLMMIPVRMQQPTDPAHCCVAAVVCIL